MRAEVVGSEDRLLPFPAKQGIPGGLLPPLSEHRP